MKLAVELEFPDEHAAAILQWLQEVPPSAVARLQKQPFWKTRKPLTKQEQRAILAELAEPLPPGAETAEEMIARIYGDRRDQPRDVEQ